MTAIHDILGMRVIPIEINLRRNIVPIIYLVAAIVLLISAYFIGIPAPVVGLAGVAILILSVISSWGLYDEPSKR